MKKKGQNWTLWTRLKRVQKSNGENVELKKSGQIEKFEKKSLKLFKLLARAKVKKFENLRISKI